VWCVKNGREDLLAEWAHPVKGAHDFLPGSGVKVPWACGECGCGWKASINNRTFNNQGCPRCARSVAATYNGAGILYRIQLYGRYLSAGGVVLESDGMTDVSIPLIKIGRVKVNSLKRDIDCIHEFFKRALHWELSVRYFPAFEYGLRGHPETGVIAKVKRCRLTLSNPR